VDARKYTIGGSAPTSLLVALHSASATPAMWDPLVADWPSPVRLMFLQGPTVHPREGFTWFSLGHEGRNSAGKLAELEAMTVRVAAEIERERAVHPEIRRVGVTGFSYGGDLAFLLALRHPNLIDVAVPMGSRLLGEPLGKRTAHIHVLQGGADAIIDVRATSMRVADLRGRGVTIELTTYKELGHEMSAAMLADWRDTLRADGWTLRGRITIPDASVSQPQ
jgi:phospholipase/carboxylesterase